MDNCPDDIDRLLASYERLTGRKETREKMEETVETLTRCAELSERSLKQFGIQIDTEPLEYDTILAMRFICILEKNGIEPTGDLCIGLAREVFLYNLEKAGRNGAIVGQELRKRMGECYGKDEKKEKKEASGNKIAE